MNILRNFLRWSFTNANDRRRLDVRNRMLRIHKMGSVESSVPLNVEFVTDKLYTFSRVETISVLPKPLHFYGQRSDAKN